MGMNIHKLQAIVEMLAACFIAIVSFSSIAKARNIDDWESFGGKRKALYNYFLKSN